MCALKQDRSMVCMLPTYSHALPLSPQKPSLDLNTITDTDTDTGTGICSSPLSACSTTFVIALPHLPNPPPLCLSYT